LLGILLCVVCVGSDLFSDCLNPAGVLERLDSGPLKTDGPANLHESNFIGPLEVIDGALADVEFSGDVAFPDEVLMNSGRLWIFVGCHYGLGIQLRKLCLPPPLDFSVKSGAGRHSARNILDRKVILPAA
jgi:hypothetical protein